MKYKVLIFFTEVTDISSYFFGMKYCFINNKTSYFHRTNGPAIMWDNGECYSYCETAKTNP